MSGLINLDEVAGSRSTHKFALAYPLPKARVVLDLIRDEDLDRARAKNFNSVIAEQQQSFRKS